MPRRAEVSTTSRTDSMPARCPSTRGRCRCAAQRPLPSMMIATWAGSRSKSTCRASASSGDPGGQRSEDVVRRLIASNRSRILASQSTPTTRNRPCGGRRRPPLGPVAPTAEQSPRIRSAGRRPRPTSTSVPTRPGPCAAGSRPRRSRTRRSRSRVRPRRRHSSAIDRVRTCVMYAAALTGMRRNRGGPCSAAARPRIAATSSGSGCARRSARRTAQHVGRSRSR